MAENGLPIGVMNTCPTCGVQFALHKNIEAIWRVNHKEFFCPNGHSLSWLDENTQDKELKTLRARVKELERQLTESKQKLEQQTAKVVDLKIRLEIWEPSDE